MAVRIQEIRIVPAVIVAFEFEELGAAGMRPCQTQREHRRLAARVRETYNLCRGHHSAESLGGLNFGGRSGSEMRALRHGFGYDLYQLGMSVSLNQRAEGHHEVDVFVSIGIPNV